MTKLNEKVVKVLDGMEFDLNTELYWDMLDKYVPVTVPVLVTDPQELSEQLGLVDNLNNLVDSETLDDDVFNLMIDYINNYTGKELIGLE